MSNKQVAETSSKKSFRPFKRNSPAGPKPPNAISNTESDGEKDEVSTNEEQTNDEAVAELQGMWDFILPNEETQEALSIATRSKNLVDLSQTNTKQKATMPTPRDKTTFNKSSPKSTQTTPSQLDSSSLAKTLIVSDKMEYNIVDDMKKTREKITFHNLSKLKHQQKMLLKELKAVPTSSLHVVVVSQAAQEIGRPPSTSLNKIDPTDITLIGGRSKYHTYPFLLTFEVFNENLHNYLVDSGASSNILPRTVCAKLNVQPQKSVVCIV